MRGRRGVVWGVAALATALLAGAAGAASAVRLVTTETLVARLHTGNITGAPRFQASPDNRHEAHPQARFGKPMVMARDGQAYGPDLQGIWTGTTTWSPDSKRLAYVAGANAKARRSVVLDGVEGKQYDEVVMESLTFSPDSRRFAYVARQGKRWFAVLDGVEGKPYEEVAWPIAFEASGNRVAYVACLEKQYFVVLDGKELSRHDTAVFPVFSAEGKLAYIARDGNASFAVVEETPQQGHGNVALLPPEFSPDGKHLAYVAHRGQEWCVVADGVDGPGYEQTFALTYSPDGTRLAYVAQQDGRSFLVVDGVAGKRYDKVSWVRFSPDGRRVACVAKRGEESGIVLEGKELGRAEAVYAPTFSPDGAHLAYLKVNKGKVTVVVDGAETRAYEGLFADTNLIFDSPTRLHTLLRFGPDRDAYVVEVELATE